MAINVRFEHKYVFFSILRLLLGAFFLFVGVRKLFRLDPFIEDIARFSLFPVSWEEWIAYTGIACELVIGVCFLLRRFYVPAVLLATCMCFSFVVIFVQGWIRGLSLSCHCLGVERQVTSYPFEVAWRVVLLGLVLSLLWEIYHKSRNLFSTSRLGIDSDL